MSEIFKTEVHKYINEYDQPMMRVRATQDNKIFGSLYAGYLENGIICLESIQVNLNLRGKGIGSTILQEFIAIIEEEGLKEIIGQMKTESGLRIKETASFYQKHGFEIDQDFNLRRRL